LVSGGLRLGVVAFLVGAATLATEISASRLLAPYFGASTVVWANIIGLTLAYLALGYWLGGRLADRRPDPRVLGGILLVAAAALAVTPFAARPFLHWALHGFDTVSVGADYTVVGLATTRAGEPMAVYAASSLEPVTEGVAATGSALAVAFPLLLLVVGSSGSAS
jgi:predicted membrane-bound spermidine synthase